MNSTSVKKLEFGNPEHIELAEKGVLCVCKHPKSDHVSWGCQKEINEIYCQCDCGDEHTKTEECSCSNFRLKEDLKFDKEGGYLRHKTYLLSILL